MDVKLNSRYQRIRRTSPDWLVNLLDTLMGFPNYSFNPIGYHGSRVPSGQPFFIVGCGRSGNTLLRTLLSKNYNVCIPPEIPGLGNTIRSFTKNRGKRWPEVVALVLREFEKNADIDRVYPNVDKIFNLNKELNLNYTSIKNDLLSREMNEQTLDSIIIAIYEYYCSGFSLKDTRIGDKTPWNVFHIGRIDRVFPEAKYVHLLRDPRAVVASYVSNFNGIKEVNIRDASLRWVDAINIIERFSKDKDRQVLEIKYERLVKNPDEVLKDVADHLKLKPLDCERTAIRFGDEDLPHYQKAFKPVDTKSLAKWKNILSESDLCIINGTCGQLMRKFGYEMNGER